jgi:hypothetical protein
MRQPPNADIKVHFNTTEPRGLRRLYKGLRERGDA